MNRVKSINIVFLMTIFFAFIGSMINSYILYPMVNNQFVSLLTSQIILLLPTIIYVLANRINFLELIRFKKIKPVNVLFLVLIAYTLTPIMSLINLLSMYFATNVIQNTVQGIATNNSFIVGLIGIAVIPSIFEEVVYRGVFYNEYRKVNCIKGMLLSGLLFGLMHMNINQFMYAFALGIMFALLIEATDSILASIIVHFVINGSSFTLTYIQPKLEAMLRENSLDSALSDTTQELTTATITAALPSVLIMAVVGGILSYILFKAIVRNSDRTEQVKAIFSKKSREQTESYTHYYEGIDKEYQRELSQTKNSQKLITVPLIVGIIILVFIMISSELAF